MNTILKSRARYKEWFNRPGNKEKKRSYYREWYKKNGRSRAVDYAEAIREWQKNNPEKVRARNKLRLALLQGKVVKSITCSSCNENKRLSAHHNDYSEPLKVVWLCSSCHKLTHLT